MSTLYVDNLQPNLGSRVMAAGHVVQVVNATYDLRTEASGAASNSFSDTGLQAVITPSASNSKILVTFNCNGVAARLGGFHQEPDLRITRNGTQVKIYANLLYQGGVNFWIPGANDAHSFGASYLDSPATAASVTYKIQMRGNTSLSGDMRVAINSSGDGSNTAGGGSSITLMEIAQ
jgi:hypothetical protein